MFKKNVRHPLLFVPLAALVFQGFWAHAKENKTNNAPKPGSSDKGETVIIGGKPYLRLKGGGYQPLSTEAPSSQPSPGSSKALTEQKGIEQKGTMSVQPPSKPVVQPATKINSPEPVSQTAVKSSSGEPTYTTYWETTDGITREVNPGQVILREGPWRGTHVKSGIHIVPSHKDEGIGRTLQRMESRIPGTITVVPKEMSQARRDFTFRENGFFGVKTYEAGSSAIKSTNEYFILPAEPKTMDLKLTGGQLQVTAFGTTWNTQTVNDSQQFQMKSPHCEMIFSGDAGSAKGNAKSPERKEFLSQQGSSLKSCTGKIVVELGQALKNESALYIKNHDFPKRMLRVSFPAPSEGTCHIAAGKIFEVKPKSDQYTIMDQARVNKALKDSPECKDLMESFIETQQKASEKGQKTEKIKAAGAGKDETVKSSSKSGNQ